MFQLSNGSRKYKLGKDLYNFKQNGKSMVKYYTLSAPFGKKLRP